MAHSVIVAMFGALLLCAACSPEPNERPASSSNPAAVRSAYAPGEGEPELRGLENADPPRFASIEEAVAFIQTKVDVPVVLPSHLPKSARLSIYGPVDVSIYEGRRGASLRLDFGVEEYLFISYGFAGFDGCPDPRPIDILGQPGMIQEHEGGGATIVWPVPKDSFEGRYGLYSYTLPADRLIRMAESMERARAETKKEQFPGC